MKIRLEWEDCSECPYFRENEVMVGDGFGTEEICTHPAIDTTIDRKYAGEPLIPEWCPLLAEGKGLR